MQNLFLIIFLFFGSAIHAKTRFYLDRSVYKSMHYTTLFIESGAMVQAVYYEAVRQLIPQLESRYGLKLQNRGEAHITAITPPEYTGATNAQKIGLCNLISSGEIHSRYRSVIQKLKFQALCIGSRQTPDGKLVFFLVLRSPGLMQLRKDLQSIYEERGRLSKIPTQFSAQNYWPHITIGYIKDDVHGVSKGVETCLPDTELIVR